MTITALPTPPARSDTPAVFVAAADAFMAALPTLVTEVNAATAAMNLNATSDTSASSVAIGTGAKSFTVTAGKSFFGGMWLVIADAAAPSTNAMYGTVTSYSGTSLVMNIVGVLGSGTISSWVISQSAPGGAEAGANTNITSLTGLTSVPLNLDLPLIGGYVSWSIGSNALTAAIKTYSGADPSASAPVFVAFRDSTANSGAYYLRSITSALSVTASSGSTLGTVSGLPSRIRCVAVDNSGTVVLGLYNAFNSSQNLLIDINDTIVKVSEFVTEGGAGAADSAQTLYVASTVTSSHAVRELSYVDSDQTTAGTWAQTLENQVQVNATTPRCGSVLQTRRSSDGAVATGTTTLPNDDTIPQSTEGVQFMTQAITPKSKSNLLLIEHVGQYASSVAAVGGNNFTCALFQDSTANALAAACAYNSGGGTPTQISLKHQMVAETTNATTFKIRCGLNAAGTTTFNGRAGAREMGGIYASYLSVSEIQT